MENLSPEEDPQFTNFLESFPVSGFTREAVLAEMASITANGPETINVASDYSGFRAISAEATLVQEFDIVSAVDEDELQPVLAEVNLVTPDSEGATRWQIRGKDDQKYICRAPGAGVGYDSWLDEVHLGQHLVTEGEGRQLLKVLKNEHWEIQ